MRILLVGGCGVGKTWVMKQLLDKHDTKPGKIGKFKFHYNDDLVLVGVYDGTTFEGSDRLSMSVITDLGKFLSWAGNRAVVCEGDRLLQRSSAREHDDGLECPQGTDDDVDEANFQRLLEEGDCDIAGLLEPRDPVDSRCFIHLIRNHLQSGHDDDPVEPDAFP